MEILLVIVALHAIKAACNALADMLDDIADQKEKDEKDRDKEKNF